MVVMDTVQISSKHGGKGGKVSTKTLLVAQEIAFAKVLAGNDKKLRDRGVKRLQKWLDARSKSDCDLKKEDFMRLWKGLFYCMWMADKPLVQEEVAETISSLVHCLCKPGPALKLIESFFQTMAIEWQGIDQHRLDKFLMLVRRFLRQSLIFVERRKWNPQDTDALCTAFEKTLLPDHANLVNIQPPLSLVMHFVDIFLEELAKVSKGSLDNVVLERFLKMFAQHLSATRDLRLRAHIAQHIFIKLMEQSPAGLEFQGKYKAWAALGFPGGSIDVMERGEEEDEDESDDEIVAHAVDDGVLDPRAGLVHVDLPLIDFNAQNVAKLLEEYRFKKYTNVKTRKYLGALSSKFEELAKGEYPLGMKQVPDVPDFKLKSLAQTAAEDLMKYQNEIMNKVDSEDESENEPLGIGSSEDEDNLKENHKDVQMAKKVTKRKISDSKKTLAKKKKMNLVEEGSDEPDESIPKVMKTKSKNNLNKKKKKSKDTSSPLKLDAKLVSGSDVDAEVEKIARIEISSPARNSPKELKKSKVPLHPVEESNVTPGTDALLQHIAPHLTGSQKLKRRVSCIPAIQTVQGSETETTPSPILGNVKKSSKRKSLSDSGNKSKWDEPLQEGEYELFIPKEAIVARKKRLSNANDSLTLPSTPVSNVKNPFSTPIQGSKLKTPNSSGKKVQIVLQRNTAQAQSEYFKTLLENPDIPFDAKREPPRGVLKPSPYSSPVNPFYKRKLKK